MSHKIKGLGSKKWFIEKYGENLGNSKYKKSCNNKKIGKNLGKKSNIERFYAYKIIKTIFGDNFKLTDTQLLEFNNWMEYYPDIRKNLDWIRQISIWIQNDMGNWAERIEKLKNIGIHRNTKESYILRHGEELGIKLYLENCNKINKNLPNSTDYWIKYGFSMEESKLKILEFQKEMSRRSVIKKEENGGHKQFSCRCIEFYINKGKTVEEAQNIISNLQKRDLDFFQIKYGEDEGFKKFEESKNKRDKTWDKKDKKEHALKALPFTYNENSQEIKAIENFIISNNINKKLCKYGAPKDQFFQIIPNIGFRRYDLAIFKDENHKFLDIIMEYHGPGHINFSEYDPILENEYITIDGRILTHLGTYGAAYKNDKIKKNHILNTYKDVKYVVIWYKDYKNKRFIIDELYRR
jgi:hypothetical protein